LVAVAVLAPLAGAQDLPDLRMREIVEETQLAQLIELRLLVDALAAAAQRLIDVRERARELEPVREALVGLLAKRLHDDVLELLRDVRAQRVNRRRRRVD